MVVYDDKIEREIGFLRQNRPYGVADSADAVTDRYDYRCFVFEFAPVKFYLIEYRRQISADGLEMCGTCFFHFNLYATVFGIDITEYGFAVFFLAHGYVGIEILVYVNDRRDAADTQPQVVKTGC